MRAVLGEKIRLMIAEGGPVGPPICYRVGEKLWPNV
jgi:hypothetical protein